MKWGGRGWLEIAEDILEICEDGALKTHIMYKCNLNSKQVTEYVQMLMDSKLMARVLDPNSKRPIFRTTAKGKKYMDAYESLERVFE